MQRRLLVSDIGNCWCGTNTTTSLSASTVKSGTIVYIKKKLNSKDVNVKKSVSIILINIYRVKRRESV